MNNKLDYNDNSTEVEEKKSCRKLDYNSNEFGDKLNTNDICNNDISAEHIAVKSEEIIDNRPKTDEEIIEEV